MADAVLGYREQGGRVYPVRGRMGLTSHRKDMAGFQDRNKSLSLGREQSRKGMGHSGHVGMDQLLYRKYPGGIQDLCERGDGRFCCQSIESKIHPTGQLDWY